jgi:hypothetical protein
MLIKGKAAKCEENGAYGGNTEIIAIMVWFIKVSVSICSIPESQVTQLTVTVGQVVTKRNAYLLLSGGLDNGQCDVASWKKNRS